MVVSFDYFFKGDHLMQISGGYFLRVTLDLHQGYNDKQLHWYY